MNQTFNFQRWCLLVARHWTENQRRYLLSIVAMAGLLFMWFVFVMLTDDHQPMAYGLQQVTYYFPLFLVGAFYASQFFKEIHSRTKGINYLLLPASILEKLLCGLFYTLLLFFVVYTLLFYLIDVLAVAAANTFHPSYGGALDRATVTNVFDLGNKEINPLAYYFFLTFIAIQSAALLGSAYFSSYHFIKTAIAFCLLFLFIFIFHSVVLSKLAPQGSFTENMGTYRFSTGENKLAQVSIPSWINNVTGFLFKYAFPPVFWAATYFRLKEKEV